MISRFTAQLRSLLTAALVASAGALSLLSGAAWAQPGAEAVLPDAVKRALAASALPSDALAFVVMRVDTGAVLAGQTVDRAMQPASTLKVLTSAVAFDRLGRAYRGRSFLASTGEVRDGVLRGDLALRGEGDVDLDANSLRRMLYAMKARGITAIDGDFVLDRSWISPSRPDLGLPPFDETPEFRYNVVPDAISLGTNLMQLDLVSTKDKVSVVASPRVANVEYVTRFALSDRACKDWEDGWLLPNVARGADGITRVELHGDFPRDCVAATQISVVDRTDYADGLFRALWTEIGGRFSGKVREGNTQFAAGATVLATHASRALPEMIHDVLKRSDNPNTRLLFFALSAPRGAAVTALDAAAQPANATASAERVRAWLREQEVDDTGLVLDNGSGLSRIEKITPMQLAKTLRAAHMKPWAAEFQAAFPVVGVDGGMRNRLAKTPLAERARLKTGTLRDVSALAGYVPGADGQPLIFVAMLNHASATSKAARPVLDALLEYAATLGETTTEPWYRRLFGGR